MGKTFDELFDDFFNKKNKKTKLPINKKDKLKKDIDFEFLKSANPNLAEVLKNFSELNEDEFEKMINNLGECDETKEYEKDGYFYQEKIWYTEAGKIVKIFIGDEPFQDTTKNETKKSLEEQLKEAINNEDYEKACKLRDEINKKK